MLNAPPPPAAPPGGAPAVRAGDGGTRVAASARERVALAALLAVLAATYVVEIAHGLPNRDVVWGYDANPLLPLIAAKKIFLDGWNTGWHTPYPNFHYYVLLVFIAPYMAVQWLLGHLGGMRMDAGYPYGLADFEATFTHLALITRAVSAAMAVGTAYFVYRIGRALDSHRAGLFAAAIAGFSPAIVYYVHVETLDVPMLFWLSIALYFYVRALQSLETRYYVGIAVFAAIATATKDYAYGAFVLMPIPLVVALARSRGGPLRAGGLARALIDRRHLAALGAFVVAFAIAENWLWNPSGFVNHVKVAGGLGSDADVVITTSFGRLDFVSPQRLRSMAPMLVFVLGWVGIVVCAAGVVYAAMRERRLLGWIAWPAVGFYVFTVCQVLPPDVRIERPYLPLLLMLALPGGIVLARLASNASRWARAAAWLAVLAIAANGIAMDGALATDPRYQAEAWLAANAAPASRIELFGLRSELPRAQNRWPTAIYTVRSARQGDTLVTAERVSPAAIAARAPDLIVVSWAFERAFAEDRKNPQGHALHEFVQRLKSGELGYTERARFRSAVSDALGFPARLTPAVAIYARG